MYLEKNLEKKWLIKSENRILGPYSFDQIIDLLRKKQISIIDEVRDPETRWLYVRENPEFKNIVEEIRKEIDARQESTKTYQSTTNTTTSTVAGNTNVFEDLGQKTNANIEVPVEENTNAREVEVVNETPMFRNENTSVLKVEKAKIYGVANDAAVQTKITDYSKRLKIIVGAVAALVIVGYVSFIFYQKHSIKAHEDELAGQVRRLKLLGMHEKSVELLETLPDATQKNLILSMLDIFPILQKANLLNPDEVKAMRALPNLQPDQKANIELIGFWLAAKQQNFGQAQDYLTNALKIQPTNLLLKENDAWLTLKRSQALAAYNEFKSLLPWENNSRYIYGMMLSYLAIPAAERSSLTKELLQIIEKYTFVYFDLRKELLLGQIFLASEMGDELIYKQSLAQFFETPTQLYFNFLKPSMLIPETYSWKDLENLKTSVFTKLTGDDALLFKIHDFIELGQLNSASEFLKVNSSKVSNPQIREHLNLLLWNAQGRSGEIVSLAQANKLNMNSSLNHLLIAQNKLKVDAKANVAPHLSKLDTKETMFYKEWIELEQIVAKSDLNSLKSFMTTHFTTIENFLPVIQARNLIN